jgi:hypothetical protein
VRNITAYGSTRWISVRDLGPLRVAPCRGVGSHFDCPIPSHHGTGELVEVAAGPGARRGVGKCAGADDGPITPEQLCGLFVGRLPDAFDKDPRGVSALQH